MTESEARRRPHQKNDFRSRGTLVSDPTPGLLEKYARSRVRLTYLRLHFLLILVRLLCRYENLHWGLKAYYDDSIASSSSTWSVRRPKAEDEHTGAIGHIALDTECRHLVSVGLEDKVLKVWLLDDLSLLSSRSAVLHLRRETERLMVSLFVGRYRRKLPMS